MKNQLAIKEATISSVELVAIINEMRPDGAAELRHDNFMTKIERHPGIDSPKFLGQYKDSTGRTLKCYYLPKREAELMVMSESLEVQTKVYDRMKALEQNLIGAPSDSPIRVSVDAAKAFPHLMRVARLLGCDKNSAALSANQAVFKLTGTNVLNLLGHTHMEAEKQELVFTPSELGVRIGGLSPQKVNKTLETLGLQEKVGDKWIPTESAKGYYRLFDTGKKHESGSPVMQMKWLDSVIGLIQKAA